MFKYIAITAAVVTTGAVVLTGYAIVKLRG